MSRPALLILLLVCASLCFALPAVAKARAKAKSKALRARPAPQVSVKYDRRMEAATRFVNSAARKRSKRLCWRAVKNALVKAKVVSKRPTTRYAKQAGRELERKYNFKKLKVTDPKKAPIGAILVYGGKGAGHVEIRTKKGYVSDFTNSRPSKRPLIGVYVTPKMIAASRGKVRRS